MVVGDPRRGDLGEHAGRLDAVLQRRGAGAQQALYHIQTAALKHNIWSESELRRFESGFYRVTQVVTYLGLVDYDFIHSPVCLILLGQFEIWQNSVVIKAR